MQYYRYHKRSISSNSASIATFSIIAIAEFVFHYAKYVDRVRLMCTQANPYLLDDDDLAYLLEHANKGLSELHVCNNQLTVKCLDTLTRYRLRALDLSHNSMGPALMKQLPRLLEKIPSLKQLSIENTGIGRFTEIDETVKAIYSNHGRKGNYSTWVKGVCLTEGILGSQGANLSLDISNNYFDCNMLTLWTPLWTHLKRISKLELSSISTEAKWLNFDLLSDLAK